jgi:hypothetical protein
MFKPNEELYLKDGCTIENAIIERADISTYDIPTVDVTLKLPCGGVVFGGICFGHQSTSNNGREEFTEGWDKGMTVLFRIMQVAGTRLWSGLKGKPVRAVLKNGQIVAMGHFLEDIFMDYKHPFWKKK